MTWACFLLSILGGSVAGGGSDPGAPPVTGDQSGVVAITLPSGSGGVLDLTGFESKRQAVEAALAEVKWPSRADALAGFGCSAVLEGRFEMAATACAMFLQEFGTGHEASECVSRSLAESLVPLDLNRTEIAFTESGPKYVPSWQMEYQPAPERLRQAVAAHELAAELATDEYDKGQLLFRLGWLHRALDDWTASTEAWDRCAEAAPNTRFADQSAWLAAENLAWTGQPGAAAERLRRLAADYTNAARRRATLERAESLQAESQRTPEWLADPVASLVAEIQERADRRAPWEVYNCVARWLERTGQKSALNDIWRWVADQADWPALVRIEAQNGLVGVLLSKCEDDDTARQEALARLEQIIELAPSDDWAAQAVAQRARLLSETNRHEEADCTEADITDKVEGSANGKEGSN